MQQPASAILGLPQPGRAKKVEFRMMNKWLPKIICLGLLLLLTACAGPKEKRPPEIRVPADENIAGLKIITEDGGHLAWCKKTNQIAFDRLGKDGYFDLWLMNPDGSGQKCLTANHPMRIGAQLASTP